MKIKLITAAIIISLVSLFAYSLEFNQTSTAGAILARLFTPQEGWTKITAPTAASTTTPDATHRTLTTFVSDANNKIFTVPVGWSYAKIRCSGKADGDVNIWDILTAGTDGKFTRRATLTFTTGTQTGNTSTFEFADELTVTNEYVLSSVTKSPAGNYIAEYIFDLGGDSYIGICGTTNVSRAYLEISGW